jgi:hypothetical protein
MLALGSSTEQILQEKTRALRTELSTCLQEIARKVAPGSSSWELKDESYRDLRPKEWKNYTSKEREQVVKKQAEVLARLPPPAEPESKITTQSSEIPKKRTESDVSETSRAVATTPKPFESPVMRPTTPSTVPSKRLADEEAVNPVRKVGGGIISGKKKSTKVTPRESSTPKPSSRETATSPAQSKTLSVKKTKENPKVKSAEKIVDSSSDSDVPLERQIKTSQPRPMEPKSIGLKGHGIPASGPDPKRQPQVISPPMQNTYRSRTSSSSSTNSFSPPKKRSPLATNAPVTARRAKSPAPSSPTSAKKRPRDEDVGSKVDKRQKLQAVEKQTLRSPSRPQKRNNDSPQIIKEKKISQEYHDLANRFRKLYPEYQELHRRLQGLDTDRLAKEKTNVDKLFRMQEQLEKWKAVLWKAAGETRHVTTERTSGMVGVKV